MWAAVSLLGTGLLSPGWVFGKYPNLALALGRGELTAAQVGDASPAYLLLHAVAAPGFVRWLQAVIAALTVAALFEVLHRRAGPLAAWLGAGLLATAQQWWVYSAVMEPDLLIGAAVALSIALVEGAPSPRRLGWAGLLAGLAVALRPTALLFGVLLLVWLVRTSTRRGVAAFVVAAVLASVLPSMVLRARAGHDLRGTMSAGQVFHQSHRPESLGFGATFPSLLKIVEAQASASGAHPPDYAHELYRELARVSDSRRTSAAEAELFWIDRSLSFFRAHPLAAARQGVEKVIGFVVPPNGEYDIPAVQPLLRRAPGVPLRWLTMLACGCLAVLIATRAAVGRPWLIHWFSSLVVALLFYFHGRYAVGLVPSLAALIGLGLAAAWKERRKLWPVVLPLAPLLLLATPTVRWNDRMVERLGRIDTDPAMTPASREAARARYLDEQAALPDVFWPTSPHGTGVGAGDLDLARQAAQLAVARYGTDSPVDATLAAALWAAADQCETAVELADRVSGSGFVWALGDRSIDPRLIASDCLVKLGRFEAALQRLEASNLEHPGRLDTLARLIAAGDVGHPTDVVRWEEDLVALHDAASVHFALAGARRRWGDPQGALVEADWLRAHWPAAAPFAEHERALCFVELHQAEAALEAWAKSLPVHAGLHEQHRLDPFVVALTQSAPGDARVAALARAHWLKRGKVMGPQGSD
ncbi:MAG: glycosyltransferase family 39 protein [Archangium sp.]|nr:glycosyltransferase family 39 protein [Archangium sp.]